ncbi:phosphomannomutase [Ardenticatena maritima]|uniref:Phosphomannomutase n=1 Tax=Ardenticatena maritima TaxID=872965 RepID=A0A0M9UBY7_9CHLR|nr:hypothetical protein [Ardenticatena maritima]GAP62280.1 phosphomannomutase [Ardenticatena maritima]
MALKFGISGLRGTIGDEADNLTPDVVLAYARAFGAWVRENSPMRTPLVALGYDGRRSSPMIADLVRGGLLSSGCAVLDLGLSLTPTVQFTVSHHATVAAGVMVTASHNPLPWNGLKFVDGEGRFIPLDVWARLHEIVERAGWVWLPLTQIPHVRPWHDEAHRRHMQAVLNAVPVEAIRGARLRVALDACNGGAARWGDMLRALGCEVIACHTEQHGFFARPPEPLPQHLGTLAALVRNAQCDVGLAADPDGDRLALVDERGDPISEEFTVVLCARERLMNRRDGVVVTNVVTTHALEDVLPNARVVRTAVGEMNVVNGVVAHEAVLGGEGSGGIIVPDVHLARDGMAAAALILSLLAQTGEPLSALVAQIPAWRMVKRKIEPRGIAADDVRALFAAWQQTPPHVECSDGHVYLASRDGSLTLAADDEGVRVEGVLPDRRRFATTLADAESRTLVQRLATTAPTLDLTDGVKLDGGDVWLSLRPSNTEPIVRLMGEWRGD